MLGWVGCLQGKYSIVYYHSNCCLNLFLSFFGGKHTILALGLLLALHLGINPGGIPETIQSAGHNSGRLYKASTLPAVLSLAPVSKDSYVLHHNVLHQLDSFGLEFGFFFFT